MASGVQAQAEEDRWVFFGTYTGQGSEGIYVSRLSGSDGKLTEPVLAAQVTSPSFLAIHPSGNFLYAVSEVQTSDGKKGGGVTAFQLDQKNGKLIKINDQWTGGAHPCHLSVDSSGKCLMVANYSGGNVASLPIHADGSLGEMASLHQHAGSSINKQRQEAPHAHSINPDKSGKYAFAADLGTDEIRGYAIDTTTAKLTPHEMVKVPAGGGPRHFTFHPSGQFAYTNNELTSTVSVFRYDPTRGVLTILGDPVSTLPADFRGNNTTAEIRCHSNGKVLYVSNRGHNSIAIFEIQADGALKLKGHVNTEGKTPRNYGLVGSYLLAANQDSDNVVVFRMDAETGALTPTGHSVQVSKPVCVVGTGR
ncbi:MAG TPA: lactonase family protein [Gemmatales bacterium]|nr:lactonase family protein [Gemmatales bacterium]